MKIIPRILRLGLFLMMLSAIPVCSRAEEPVAVSKVERERCLALLREGLASDEFWPAMHAAEALSLAGESEAVVSALRLRLPLERNDQRRCGLARELVRAGDKTALPVLFGILEDSRSNGRIHAAESLYKLGVQHPVLTETFLQTEVPQLQLMSAAALARQGNAEALAWLRARLQSEDRLVRNTVCFALARLGGPEDLPALRERLALETDSLARANLINALATLGDPKGRESLGDSLNSKEPGIRASAAEHAGHARCLEYRQRLIALLDDPAIDVRIRAAQSLFLLARPGSRLQSPIPSGKRNAP